MTLVHATDNPLVTLQQHIAQARQLVNEPLGVEPRPRDPLAQLDAHVARGQRVASFAPPLTGIVADIASAAHLYDHGAPHEEGGRQDHYDILDVLSPPPATPPGVVRLKPAAPAPRVSPKLARPSPPSGGGGVIASVLLDAIAKRDLPGAARAEAARLLSEGLALGDEQLMREALATLITGA